jgi:hypothetical protein
MRQSAARTATRYSPPSNSSTALVSPVEPATVPSQRSASGVALAELRAASGVAPLMPS